MSFTAGIGRPSTLAKKLMLFVIGAVALVSGASNATLMLEPDGVVLDTISTLEWEQNANHGPFNWAGAGTYASGVSLDGSGWRLPTINELVDLYAHLSAQTGCSACTGDKGPFTGIQPDYSSATEFNSFSAWNFDFSGGFLNVVGKSYELSAWAVRAGDVAVAAEPASLLLFGVGALGLALSRRRGRQIGRAS